MNVRLIVALLTSLIDEIIILAILLWLLPMAGVVLPWWGIFLVTLVFITWAVMTYILGSRVLRKRPLPGLTDMQGMEGTAVSPLAPEGQVKIKGEIWKARSKSGIIQNGARIVVTGQDGLRLIVSSESQNRLQDLSGN